MIAIGGTGICVLGFLGAGSSRERLSVTLSVSSAGGGDVEIHLYVDQRSSASGAVSFVRSTG